MKIAGEGKVPMLESQDKCLENAAMVQIKTRKYQAIPHENPGEEALLLITTARKSSFEAQNLCPSCGKKISPDESRVCECCGSETCVHCIRSYQEEVRLEEK